MNIVIWVFIAIFATHIYILLHALCTNDEIALKRYEYINFLPFLIQIL